MVANPFSNKKLAADVRHARAWNTGWICFQLGAVLHGPYVHVRSSQSPRYQLKSRQPTKSCSVEIKGRRLLREYLGQPGLLLSTYLEAKVNPPRLLLTSHLEMDWYCHRNPFVSPHGFGDFAYDNESETHCIVLQQYNVQPGGVSCQITCRFCPASC